MTIGSATRTAPPVIRATPAAVAESLATASFTDIEPNLVFVSWSDAAPPHLHQFNGVMRLKNGSQQRG